MKQPRYYRQFYEQTDIREENISSEERVPATIGLIPEGVRSVLDLGCGNGTLLSYMDAAMDKVGVDISFTALQKVKTRHRVLSSSEHLPFRKDAFDLVLCTEVLEHLPLPIYGLTLSEMQRIARNFILISVPYKEDLDRKQARCSRCGRIYHVHLHLRSFDFQAIKDLFSFHRMKEYRFSGPRERFFPKWALNIRRKYGQRWEWDKNTLCPQCGHKSKHPPKRSMISITTSIIYMLSGKRHPKWVSVLYEKK